jgi:hypothetical protein
MEFIPIVVLIAVVIISRVLGEKGSRELTNDQKEQIVAELIKVRRIFLMPIIAFFGTYILCLYSLKLQTFEVNKVYFPVLAVLLSAVYYISYIKLRSLKLGDNFNRYYILSKLAIMAGVFAFMALMFILRPDKIAF